MPRKLPTVPTMSPGASRAYILRIAAAAHADPRTVERELAAQRGSGNPVRGNVGERIRIAIAQEPKA